MKTTKKKKMLKAPFNVILREEAPIWKRNAIFSLYDEDTWPFYNFPKDVLFSFI